MYFEDSASKLDKLDARLRENPVDFNEIDLLVHQFKGSSASFGAHAMAKLCVQLREQCQVSGLSERGVISPCSCNGGRHLSNVLLECRHRTPGLANSWSSRHARHSRRCGRLLHSLTSLRCSESTSQRSTNRMTSPGMNGYQEFFWRLCARAVDVNCAYATAIGGRNLGTCQAGNISAIRGVVFNCDPDSYLLVVVLLPLVTLDIHRFEILHRAG